jgi:hypothetical protein
MISNEDGAFKAILSLVVIVFLIYAGFQFAMPYYRYSAFKTDAKELARISVGDAERTKTQILGRAKELKIPIGEKTLEVIKKDNTVQVKASWSETVDLLGLYQKTLTFDVDIEE